MKGEEDLSSYKYPTTMYETLQQHGDGAAMYWATFIYKELERFDVTIEDGDIFVDLGANIGMSSRYAYEKGASEIYSFEPDPNLTELIKKNVPTAKIYQNAIDKDIKDIELYHWPYNPVNVGPKYKTSTVRIKDILKLVGKNIDYLKVDIEGFEDPVFSDISLEDLRKIKKIFIEYHNQSNVHIFCEQLKNKGLNINVEHGAGQSYIYATNRGAINNGPKKQYDFNSRWDWNEQKITYSSSENIDFPILVTLKEYMSNAVLWSVDCDSLPANCEYWIIPISKNACDYSTSRFLSGIKFCIYRKDTQEQIYEQPFFKKFVNLPTVTLSNKAPYFINYLEYFVQGKYDRWLKSGKKFPVAVDVGANIGLFTEFLIKNKLSKKIVSVECDEDALKDLVSNYELNDNVKIINKALNDTAEPITFYHCPENSIISSTIAPSNVAHHRHGLLGNKATTVQTVTLGDLVDDLKHIDLLKIDIEGAEYKIIESADPKLFNAIDNIFMECHFFEKDYKEKYSKILTKLKGMGYEVEEDVVGSVEEYVGSSECIFATRL
jgi:FkbM family methyltransferase